MKTLLLIMCALFVIAARPAHAVDTYLKATVSGTVQTQKLLSPTDGRAHTTILNNKRIFQEFQVSQADYELVVDLSNSARLLLVPKHTSGGLPTISVLTFGGGSQSVVDTKAHNYLFVTNIAPGAATNLFKNLAGEISATAHFIGDFSTGQVNRLNFSVVGHGTDPTGAGDGPALLKFKVTTGAFFAQKA